MATVQLTPATHLALQERKQAQGARSIDAVIQELLSPRPRKDDVLAGLRLATQALRGFGVRRVRLFGSVARDAAHPESDVDLIVDLEDGRDYVDLAHVQRLLEAILHARCDVVLPTGLHPRLAQRILGEAEEVDLA